MTKNAPSAAPVAKVAAGGIAGMATTVLVWGAGQLGVDLPPEIAGAIVGLAMFVAGYLKRG